MLSWVSTEMGDCSQVYHLSVQPSHPGQLSLVIPIWVSEMSTNDGYGYRWGRKRRVLRNSRPCDQDCWHTDLVG